MSWRNGRIILIGDAAHGMLPHQGQGGSQAVRRLCFGRFARCLDITNWFDIFEQIRKPRAEAITIWSRAMGRAFDDLQLRQKEWNSCAKATHGFSLLGLGGVRNQMKKSFGPNSVEWENPTTLSVSAPVIRCFVW
ncbi:uncharacterized protein EAE98_006437 [Botrytis deweyae]|uniref:FAD-binding domain-containing protein n=1 Tax=Botrytis deweyae TaxID=2478750 RepID=A0ABQ7IJB9_9HELO|nr:uncharacterized protein EAE98_006437 [Botrytis deweyae]KAF7926142.1 hypothetical protein EAE98_006437 [Botrytis deweyae]